MQQLEWQHLGSLSRNAAGLQHIDLSDSDGLAVMFQTIHRAEIRDSVRVEVIVEKDEAAVPRVSEVLLTAGEGVSIRPTDLRAVTKADLEEILDRSMIMYVVVEGHEHLVAFGDVRDQLTEAGKKRKRTQLSDRFLKEIADKVAAGMSTREIADSHPPDGVDRSTAHRWIERARYRGFLPPKEGDDDARS